MSNEYEHNPVVEKAKAISMCVLAVSASVLILSLSLSLFIDKPKNEPAPFPRPEYKYESIPLRDGPPVVQHDSRAHRPHPPVAAQPVPLPGKDFSKAYEQGLEASTEIYSECIRRLLVAPPADILAGFGEGRVMTLPGGEKLDLSDVYSAQTVRNVKAFDECFHALLADSRDNTGRLLGYDMGPKKDHLAEIMGGKE